MTTNAESGELTRAFAPIHRLAVGVSAGTVCGLVMLLTTVFQIVIQPQQAPNLELLGQYFYGYEVSWSGGVIGAAWGFATGFAMGWCAAFVRNSVMAAGVFLVRTKAELVRARDFFDRL